MPSLPPYPSCPLRSPKELNPKPLLLQFRGLNWHHRPPPQLSPKLWRWPSPPYDTPSPECGGIKKIYIYKGQVKGCSEEPSTSQATICTHVCHAHLGVRLVCPSCNQTFLNLDALRHHKKSMLLMLGVYLNSFHLIVSFKCCEILLGSLFLFLVLKVASCVFFVFKSCGSARQIVFKGHFICFCF